MSNPTNAAAFMITKAQGVITDLTTQAAEIQKAITSQQTLIDSLLPVAVWEDPPEEPEAPTVPPGPAE